MSDVCLPAIEIPELRAIPGLVHGFERRLPAPGRETREDSRQRVGQSLQGAGRLLLMKQVHGSRVLCAPWEGTPEADAATASEAGWILGVETADCLPLLLVDPRRRAIAAVHAGWRGTAAGIAARAVEALVAGGSRPRDLVAALGPGIGPCCYEVGDELRPAFGPHGSELFRPGPHGRPHLDVREANRRQLQGAGLVPERIHDVDECTCCREDLYHSYRREGAGAGRMISFVGFRL